MKPLLLILAILGVVTALAAEPAGSPVALRPFTARYGVVWRGFNAGTTDLDLTRSPEGQFVYASRANARGLFRAVFSEEITQTSWFDVTEQGVRPLRYRADDGSEDTDRDISLDFDWPAGRARGTAEEKAVDVALEPGVQDAMSIQMALMLDLLRGAKPQTYRLIDKDRIKEYRYAYEGEARLKTALGELDTVIYTSQRAGSKRLTRTWYAPSLGYVAVRGEQIRDGKREWVMDIRSLDRS
ncbi:MAG: DUF3108 domain-containing protein [Gemmatimonadetes bacterium]|nr:DUF3108 domain-containing protein [Gemmatimonadota bacterium]